MTLSFVEIKSLTQGAEAVIQAEKGVEFHRFTDLEAEAFHTDHGRYKKVFATAGVRLEFETDAKALFLKVRVDTASSRSYFAVDVLVNGERTDSIRNSPEKELFGTNYSENPYPWKNEIFEKRFHLGEGIKRVSVYFPWSFSVSLAEMSLEGDTYIKALPRAKKMLMLGDSITHGYDALCPSRSYASLLSTRLGAEEYNKAIGGECFYPELAKRLTVRDYDLITVAYGTNDWHRSSMTVARELCEGFFRALCEKFSQTKIFVVSPIWRTDRETLKTALGPFSEMEKMIFDVAGKYENTVSISGIDLVPHQTSLYGDLSLHPNDNGFARYAENLHREIQKYGF